MKKRIMASCLAGLVLLPGMAQAAIPGTAAQPSLYEVTVTQVELCSDAACTTSYIAGSGSQSFDISAATAGADVGSYADLSGIPLFQTWSHVRVTISTTINVGATWNDGTDNCGTSNPAQASSHAQTYQAPANGTATPAAFVIPNVGFSGITAADFSAFNLSKSNGAGTATITYPLNAPYTCKGVMPRIEVEFNTSQAFGFIDPGAGQCAAFPRPPEVTITVTDP